jgi:hypothetical protein
MTGRLIFPRNDPLAEFVGEGDRFRLIRFIAEDWLGQIWHGQDAARRIAVTIRRVRQSRMQDQTQADALRQRLKALHPRLAHPNIASVSSYDGREGGPMRFLVLEELRGQTLAHRLKHGPVLQLQQAFAIGAAIAQGLEAAHDLAFAHEGLTAHSVMLDDDGSVKILDFGLAALRPDQDRAHPAEGPHGDVRALGTLLREMCGSQWPRGTLFDPSASGGVSLQLKRLWQSSLDPDTSVRPTAHTLGEALRTASEAGNPGPRKEEEHPKPEKDRKAMAKSTAPAWEVALRGRAVARADQASRRAELQFTHTKKPRDPTVGDENRSGAQATALPEPTRISREASTPGEQDRLEVLGAGTRPAPMTGASAARERSVWAGRKPPSTRGGVRVKQAPVVINVRWEGEVARSQNGNGAPRPGRILRGEATARGTLRGATPSLLRADRGWWWIGGIMVVVALLGFMWTRPGTEPAGEKRAPITSRTTTRSDMMVMPDLRDLTFSEVVSRLGDMNLVLGRAVEAQGQPGIVMATDPGLGRLVRPGTQVIVYVGASEALIDESDDHGLLGE